MEYSVLIENVQMYTVTDLYRILDNINFSLVDRELKELESRVQFKAGDDPKHFAIDQYHNLQEVSIWK